MNDFIIKYLELKQEDILSIKYHEIMNELHITILLQRKTHRCPNCFLESSKIKDYSLKKFSHTFINKKQTYIIYKCRRYICPYCHKSFIEDNPFGKQYSSLSNLTLISILDDFKSYTATYTAIAKKHNVSVSTVVNVFDNHVQIQRHKLQEIICIDEFYFNRHSHHKYALMIMGFKTNSL